MAMQAQRELIDNFILEAQPYLALIDQAVLELDRPEPDTETVDQAIEALEIIRGASDVLSFNGLTRLAAELEVALSGLLDATMPEREELRHRAEAMAAGVHRYMEALVAGHDTGELVGSVLAAFERDAPGTAWRGTDELISVATLATDTLLLPASETAAGDPELRAIFEEEATELVASFTRHALTLVSASDRSRALAGLRRDAHTLKGAANMTGFPLVGALGAAIESLIDVHLDADAPVERETMGVILSARKLLAGMLSSLDNLTIFNEQTRSLVERAGVLQSGITRQSPDVEELIGSATGEAAQVTDEPIDVLVSDEPRLGDEPRPGDEPETPVHGPVEPEMADEPAAAGAIAEQPAVFESAPEPAEDTALVAMAEVEPESAEDTLVAETAPVGADTSGVEPVDVELEPPCAPDVATIDAAPGDLPTSAEIEDEPEVDVYEIAAEIATLARLRTSLTPGNATVFPTEPSDLTDDINALSAEFVNDAAFIPAVVNEPASDHAQDHLVTAEADQEESLATETAGRTFLVPDVFYQDDDSLGHALLDLAVDGGAGSDPAWPMPVAQDDQLADEQMRQELRETFAAEAIEHADALTRAAMALESDPESDYALREIARILHTLKGAAAAATFDEISDRCHQIEELLATGIDIDSALTGQILNLAATIEQETSDDPAGDDMPREPLPVASRGAGDLRVSLRRLDGLLNVVGELVINRSTFDQRLQRLAASLDELTHMTERLRRSGQTLERVASEISLIGPLPSEPADGRIVTLHGHDARREFDSLEMDRYTDLDVLARELAEVASDISAVAGEARGLRGDFETVSTHQRRLTNEIQDELMSIRMVPLASLAPLLYRVVRRVAHESGKEVDLVLEGGETVFDKSLIDSLGDALLHLLRNAVDHGIEAPEARERAGKSARGLVTVRAWQDRGNAVVEVLDDGNGIDTTRLIERGRAFGFVADETVSDAEALQLMFLPGFTTREVVDAVSGRGVGLDVVREAVERVKGRVTVDTKTGGGTIFQLRLPVMLAVAQAFLVEAGGRRFAVPLSEIDYVADRRGAKLSRVGHTALLELNETVIPAVDLAARLAGADDRLADDEGWLLITRSGGEPRALRVDALHGQQEIVVKPLGRYLGAAPGVAGATILGDGQIALIVDVADVVSTRAASGDQTTTPEPPIALDSARHGKGTALIVDDSLSVRRVLARTLERHGWAALQAHDGVEALEIIQEGEIDIVVTDIEMPRMDGYELISSLRRSSQAGLPVVVLTSRSSGKHRDKAYELGANAYIVKPFQEQELIQTLEREMIGVRVAG